MSKKNFPHSLLWGDVMIEIILMTVTLFFAAVGLGEVLHRLWICLIRPQKTEKHLIIRLNEKCAAEEISAALEEIRWYGENYAKTLIGVGDNLSLETAALCRRFSQKNTDFVFCTAEQLQEMYEK